VRRPRWQAVRRPRWRPARRAVRAVWAGYAGSVALVAALLAGWRMPWAAQVALAAALGLQFHTIGRLSAVRLWHWADGYSAAVDDLGAPSPPASRGAQ